MFSFCIAWFSLIEAIAAFLGCIKFEEKFSFKKVVGDESLALLFLKLAFKPSVVEKDKFSAANTFSSGSNYDVVSDYSNVPYQNVTYYKLNAVGKQWVKKYFLALCKENLGMIRQKYSTIPIPGGEVTLDGSELRSEAASEKESLITQLRENLEATSRKAQMEAKADETEKMTVIMKTVPLLIYIG